MQRQQREKKLAKRKKKNNRKNPKIEVTKMNNCTKMGHSSVPLLTGAHELETSRKIDLYTVNLFF